MGTEVIRVNAEDHKYIMDLAHDKGETASSIIGAWVARSKSENGEIEDNSPVFGASGRPAQKSLYSLNITEMKSIVSPVPQERIYPIKVIPRVEDMDKYIGKDPYLSRTIWKGNVTSEYDNWFIGTHNIVKCIGYISGSKRGLIAAEAVALLYNIKNFIIVVHEESPGVFIPVNDTAANIMQIVNISALTGKRIKKAHQYFTPSDIFILWESGWDIEYAKNNQ